MLKNNSGWKCNEVNERIFTNEILFGGRCGREKFVLFLNISTNFLNDL